MDRAAIREFASNISPLLTLSKIHNSRKEMIYITKMRNALQLNIWSQDHFENLGHYFNHKFLLAEELLEVFYVCLCHAFRVVANNQILVLTLDNLKECGSILKDHRGFHAIHSSLNTNIKSLFLVRDLLAYEHLPNWNPSLTRELEINPEIPLSSIVKSPQVFQHLRCESTWRRVYESNNSYFFSKHSDIDIYVKESTEKNRPVNVLKQIMRRETGYSMNEFSVLETIASPYYYELPHQDESEYSDFERYMHWSCRRNYSDFMSCYVRLEMIIVVKNVA
ncbi:uncharacterized protein NPIL_531811 [Nephila pilipes]|uniref:Uncharacterized protein n=1 Tax=Nephila pilipes TaxID=299642 RepID=A0A8X6UJI8_NEPPI|nr:uncharacterized protein NPIL_531811 [Nephila pilipes]